MSIKDKTKGLATALRLDSHHAIERFGVIFAVIIVSFGLLLGGATTSSLANQQADLDTTTLYTKAFTTSKTQLGGDVTGIFVSPDKTRAMVLMHFKSTSLMSSNAEKYRAFLTGSNKELTPEPLKGDVSAQIVVFGSTGYMATVLESPSPFPQQILNLTMRANSELVYQPSEKRKVREDLAGQASFTEFDQWRLYFNPGASGATVTESLAGETLDAWAVYSELVVKPEEDALRVTLDNQLAEMQTDQARIVEYQSDARRVNVDGVTLELPETPAQIAGDVVDGSPAIGDTASTLELKPVWVSPRGWNFSWRDGRASSGYLDEIIGDGQSYVTYLADKQSQAKGDESGSLRTATLDWTLSNGRLLKDFTSADKAMQPLMEIRNDLSQAWEDYYTHKVEYQTKTLAQLIDLEVELRTVRTSTSINTADDVLFTY